MQTSSFSFRDVTWRQVTSGAFGAGKLHRPSLSFKHETQAVLSRIYLTPRSCFSLLVSSCHQMLRMKDEPVSKGRDPTPAVQGGAGKHVGIHDAVCFRTLIRCEKAHGGLETVHPRVSGRSGNGLGPWDPGTLLPSLPFQQSD